MTPEEIDERLDLDWFISKLDGCDFCDIESTDEGVQLTDLDIDDVPDGEMVWVGEVKKHRGGRCESTFRIYGDNCFVDMSKREVLKCIDGHIDKRIVKHLNLDDPDSAQTYPEGFDYYVKRAIQRSFDSLLD